MAASQAGSDDEQQQRHQDRGDRDHATSAADHADDRRQQAGQAEHHAERLVAARLHALHPVVELGVVERRQVDRRGHVEHPALHVAADQLAEDLLPLALHRAGERLDAGDGGHRQRPRQQAAPSDAPLLHGVQQRVERGLAEQQQRGDAEAADHLERGGDHDVVSGRPPRRSAGPRELSRGRWRRPAGSGGSSMPNITTTRPVSSAAGTTATPLRGVRGRSPMVACP